MVKNILSGWLIINVRILCAKKRDQLMLVSFTNFLWRSPFWYFYILGGRNENAGDRNPAVFLYRGGTETSPELKMSLVNDNPYDMITYVPNIQLNKTYNVKIQSRYTSHGNYLMTFNVNGVKHGQFDSTPKQMYNMKVYLGEPWEVPCLGTVSNFKVTNFL